MVLTIAQVLFLFDCDLMLRVCSESAFMVSCFVLILVLSIFFSPGVEVNVEVCDKDGKLLSNNQLEKQYCDWIKKMHEKYDVEMDDGNDNPTFIINPSCKERLGLSKNGEGLWIL